MKKTTLIQQTNTLQIETPTPLGKVYLLASAKGLQKLSWKRQPVPSIESSPYDNIAASKHLDRAKRQLEEYFLGKRKKFRLKFDFNNHGTPFQRQVWQKLEQIPHGETWSYQKLAKSIDRPKAYRAVGSANGRNPLPIVIPCHRVITSDGKIGGYTGGVAIKQRLLRLEGHN